MSDRPRCPDHVHHLPCPMCRAEHRAGEHTTTRDHCTLCAGGADVVPLRARARPTARHPNTAALADTPDGPWSPTAVLATLPTDQP